jgi:hypothetical protein
MCQFLVDGHGPVGGQGGGSRLATQDRAAMRQLQLDFTHVAMEALPDDRAFESIRARARYHE